MKFVKTKEGPQLYKICKNFDRTVLKEIIELFDHFNYASRLLILRFSRNFIYGPPIKDFSENRRDLCQFIKAVIIALKALWWQISRRLKNVRNQLSLLSFGLLWIFVGYAKIYWNSLESFGENDKSRKTNCFLDNLDSFW